DTYAEDARLTAENVADCVPGLKNWRFAFQSQGMSGGPWIGPTVEDTLTALREEGHKAVVIHPIGFLCDHVEILYDIDIAFRDFGRNIGLRVERPRSLNSSPLLIAALRGIAGLSAACELARSGIEFTLYEASNRLGGIVETVHRDGFVVECGPDSWVTEKPWAREVAVELGLEDEIIPSNDQMRKTYIVRGRELVAMPDGMRMMVPTQWEPVLSSPLFSKQARQAYLREPERAEELKASA